MVEQPSGTKLGVVSAPTLVPVSDGDLITKPNRFRSGLYIC